MIEVELGQRDLRRLEPFVGPERVALAFETAARFRTWLGERAIWNVSSTAVGGGVAEMLAPLLSYSRSLGIPVRWLVMEGSAPFFRITKRLHHAIHGSTGDGSPLDDVARRVYDEVSRLNAAALVRFVRPGDLVLLHDPQTAGLAPPLAARGARIAWRSHIGHDAPSEEVDRGWGFLAPYLRAARATIFSRAGYVPPGLDADRSHIVQPSIDALSPKNQPLDPASVRAILHHVGAIAGAGSAPPGPVRFRQEGGGTGQVSRRADIVRHGAAPEPDDPLVVQVSRWDPLKDMAGVMQGFAELVTEGRAGRAHLLLAGPDVRGVTDDPEGPAVFGAAAEAWRRLPEPVRARIALCMLPTEDIEENATIVNALQRHAAIVIQKSLHEGFGLTVTEAMWKSRPVIASAVGGIRDQIDDGVHGVLLPDPRDLRRLREVIAALLVDRDRAARLGEAARERVRERFLGVRHLLQYADIFRRLDEEAGPDLRPAA